jgi:bifunctional DNase/RNase
MEMIETEIWTITRGEKGSAVMLRSLESDFVVPIFIGQLEIQSILSGSGGPKLFRPLSHDLFLSLLSHTGLSLRRIEIFLRNDIFNARIIIYGGQFSEKKPLILPSRPSDAFALAVRQGCPIYVSQGTLKKAGMPSAFILEGIEENGETPVPIPPEIKPAPFSRAGKCRRLLEELRLAVDSEEYERAAELRDQLLLLEKGDTRQET